MIYLKPNRFSTKYIVPTELILFLRLFSTNISFLTELCYKFITQQIGQTSSIDIYSFFPLESIRERMEKGREALPLQGVFASLALKPSRLQPLRSIVFSPPDLCPSPL